jgi:hypothetical protein
MNPDYTEIQAGNSIINCVQGIAGTLCFVLVILFCFIFNIIGFCIGLDHQNATCYVDKYWLSLSSWLIWTNAGLFVGCGMILIFFALTRIKPEVELFIFTFLVGTGLFFFTMTIEGIIELAYQFPACKDEVGIVCGLVITTIIINLMGSSSAYRYRKNE